MAGKYQVVQNASSTNKLSLAHALKGSPVGGAGGVEHQTGTVQLAPQALMSEYRPPKRRLRDDPDRLLCSEPECKAFPMKTLPYCSGHARSKGLIKNWGRDGTKREPLTDESG